MIRKWIVSITVGLLLVAAARAEEIPLESLGKLTLDYNKIVLVDTYPGQRIAAEVTFKKGQAFTLVAPRRVQQIHYLVEVGETVSKGQPIAELRGPEMHHFLDEMEVSKHLLESAERRFNSNKVLFKKKAIKESQWAEVSEKYYAAQLEYEHMRHFNDLVINVDESENLIVLGAPISGVVNYAVDYAGLKLGDDIAIFVPHSAIRLESALPASARNNLVKLKTSHCELEVSSVGGVANNFFVSVWSEPIKEECGLILGQTLLLTPIYAAKGYRVPKGAVFQLHGASTILVLKGEVLVSVEVSLIASEGGHYIVSSAELIENADVLTSSISAVQGILLGLGGE